VTTLASRLRRVVLATLVAMLIGSAPATLAGQSRTANAPQQQATAPPDPEAEREHAAPVLVGGEPIFWITTGVGPYTAQFRADRIAHRVNDAVRDRTIADPTVTVTETEGSSELRVGPRLLMVVTQQDAASLGTSRAYIATQYAQAIEHAIRDERQRYAPAALMRSGVIGLLATLVLGVTVWLILRLARSIRGAIERRRAQRSLSVRVLDTEIVSADRLTLAIDRTIGLIRFVLIALVFGVYLTLVLGLFPWTRAVSRTLIGYVLTPIRAAAVAFIEYLPNLLFVIVIGAIIYGAIRLVGLFFRQIGQGRLVFESFPAEWADPTNKIIRVLLIAFGVVVAFPYLPASDSPAFAGVSVFIGVLVSLSSSSALSNMIAGLVMTYTGAFRLGDRVKLGDAFGDVVETSLLATHVRTIKNEEITIPNSIALSSAVTNYSRIAKTRGLILHTSVTIGYDAPWRKVHDLLIDAALATPGVLHDPRPFVWQTALNDFYVTYEINAYTDAPRDMLDIYAALHARIQDAFYAAGVEIMSPHYTSLRDGNTVAIPEALRAQDYRVPAFRVEDVTSGRGLPRESGGVARSG
jgi:small-conductance mechanosensitive channel